MICGIRWGAKEFLMNSYSSPPLVVDHIVDEWTKKYFMANEMGYNLKLG